AEGQVSSFSTYAASVLPQGKARTSADGTWWDWIDFSTGQRLDTSGGVNADIKFQAWWDQFGVTGISPGLQAQAGAGIVDMGKIPLLQVTIVPEGGYSAALLAKGGHCYAVRTKEGKYAKFKITYMAFGDTSYPVYFELDWVFQPDGSRSF
ncbi:unnamed protein product, partial [marine sediment metagenome]